MPPIPASGAFPPSQPMPETGEAPLPPAMNPGAGHTFSRKRLDGRHDLLPNQGTAQRRPRMQVMGRETTEGFAAPGSVPAGPPAPPPRARRDPASGAEKKNV